MLTSSARGICICFFCQRDKRDFTGPFQNVRDGAFGIGTILKKYGTGPFKNISGRHIRDRDNKKVCPAGL